MEFCGSRDAGRKRLSFTKHQWQAKFNIKHIAIHPHKHLQEYSDDEAEAHGGYFVISRLHGTVEWQSINVDLKLILLLSIASQIQPIWEIKFKMLSSPVSYSRFCHKAWTSDKIKEYIQRASKMFLST